jgi:hypothetical protein
MVYFLNWEPGHLNQYSDMLRGGQSEFPSLALYVAVTSPPPNFAINMFVPLPPTLLGYRTPLYPLVFYIFFAVSNLKKVGDLFFSELLVTRICSRGLRDNRKCAVITYIDQA